MNSVLHGLRKSYDSVLRLCSSETQQDVSTPHARTYNVFNSILSPFETYVVSLQSLLIWERPHLSAAAFVSVNILYWLIVSWNRRFFSIVSISSIAVFLYRTWIKQIWPEIRVPPHEDEDTESWTPLNPDVLSVPEISRYLNDFLEKCVMLWKDIWKLRKENHGFFCSLMCGFFSVMAFIGKLFPGVLIVYFAVLLLTLGPGIALHLIPSTVYDQIIGFFTESDSQDSANGSVSPDSDLEEFVPQMSPELLRQLSLQDEPLPELPSPGRVLADLTVEESNQSEDLSFYQGLGSFPSVEEEGESDLEDDSSNSAPKAMGSDPKLHFDPQHFREESSESEADSFAQGLAFDSTKETVVMKTSSDLEDDLMDFEVLEGSDIPTNIFTNAKTT